MSKLAANSLVCIVAFLLFGVVRPAFAHPMVEDAIDVIIEPGKIVVIARISPEQILQAQHKGAAIQQSDQWPQIIRDHAAYLRAHLRITTDGVPATAATANPSDTAAKVSALVSYRLEYPIPKPPRIVEVSQNFLEELQWSATCVVRMRQSTQRSFETSMMPANQAVSFSCDWPDVANAPRGGSADQAIQTNVRVGPTFAAYTAHGVMHILTGYDHLLFVSALVLAATGIWDLVKVVSAFTLAHTLTLTLSVFNIVTLSERIVEPMIAASIVFVALQNVLWPRSSRGWSRLAAAFGFGLFHGLGFAGGLKEAMADMPVMALWTALAAFSLGVEVGHQIVVIPLFTLLQVARQSAMRIRQTASASRLWQLGSIAICAAGVYFLIAAVR